MTLFSIKNPFSGKCSTQSSRYWHSQQLLLINMGIQIHTTPVNTFYWTRTVPDHLYQLDLSNCKSLQMSIPPLPPLCYTIHEFQVKNNQGKFVLMSLRDLRSNNMTGTGDRRDWESTLLPLLFKCWPWGSTVPLQETPARRPTLHQVNKLTFTFFLRSITRHSVSKL